MGSDKKRPHPGEGMPPPSMLRKIAEDQIHIEIDRETFDKQQEEINAQKRQKLNENAGSTISSKLKHEIQKQQVNTKPSL